MRVLIVTTDNISTSFTGQGIFLSEYCRHLKQYSEVMVIYIHLSDDPPPAVGEVFDAVVVPEPVFPAFDNKAWYLDWAHAAYAQARTQLDDFAPDVIHCNDKDAYLVFRHCANVVYSSHMCVPDMLGTRNLNDKWLFELHKEQAAARNAAAFLVYSQFARKRILENVCRDASPIVRRLGIDLVNYYDRPSKEGLRIAFFGRLLNLQKGLDHFMAAVDRFDPAFLNRHGVEIYLYGKTNEPEQYRRANIASVQYVTGAEKYRAFAETDIVVMPSTYEPFGLVGIEALASGCLLITREGLGMDEYLVPGNNYVPLPETSADAIYNTLYEVIENYQRYAGLHKNSRTSVEGWNMDACVQSHLEIYEAIQTGRIRGLRAVQSEAAHRIQQWRTDELPIRNQRWVDLYEEMSGDVKSRKALWIGASEVAAAASHTGLSELLPFADESYETVVALGELEFGPDPQAAVHELLRVARHQLIIGVGFGVYDWHQVFAFAGPEDVLQLFREPIEHTVVFQDEHRAVLRLTKG